MSNENFRSVIFAILLSYYLVCLVLLFLPHEMVFGYAFVDIVRKNFRGAFEIVFLVVMTFLPYLMMMSSELKSVDKRSYYFGYYISLSIMVWYVFSPGLAVSYVAIAGSYRNSVANKRDSHPNKNN